MVGVRNRSSLLKRLALGVLVALAGVLVVIQLAPYGRSHTNPPVRGEPVWDSPDTHALAVRACYDCHSNETRWPWYTNVAPVSWLAQYDVDKGRRELNFSEFDRPPREPEEAAKEVRQGKMPQWFYVLAHPEANLSPAERQTLIQGLDATLGRRVRAR